MNHHFRVPDSAGDLHRITDQRTFVARVLHISDSGAGGIKSGIQLILALLVGGVIAWLASPASPFKHNVAIGIAAAVALPALCLILMLRDSRRS